MARRRSLLSEASRDDVMPVTLLNLPGLSRAEARRRRDARAAWFAARDIPRDWSTRSRLIRAAEDAAGIIRPDPRPLLYTTDKEKSDA